MHSLDDSIQVIFPHLAPALVSPDELPAIRQTARFLAPLHWGGFECRLGENRIQVDFHQGIEADDETLKILENHISSTVLSDNAAWNSIRKFCERLRFSSSPLQGTATNIVLEFDNSGLTSRIPIPSLFIRFAKDTSREQLFITIETALEQFLKKSVFLKLLPNFRRCFDACPDGTNISDIGIMLSRNSEVVRINVNGISPVQLQNFLDDIRWEGKANDLEATFIHFLALVDYIVLCLDIGDKVYPKIGLDCFISRDPNQAPRWALFFDELVKSGLCSPVKRNALLTWPGYTFPKTNTAPWPGNLIVESLLQSSNKFSLFSRWLSHIKINYQPNLPLEAKGYIGFKHIWRAKQ